MSPASGLQRTLASWPRASLARWEVSALYKYVQGSAQTQSLELAVQSKSTAQQCYLNTVTNREGKAHTVKTPKPYGEAQALESTCEAGHTSD